MTVIEQEILELEARYKQQQQQLSYSHILMAKDLLNINNKKYLAIGQDNIMCFVQYCGSTEH